MPCVAKKDEIARPQLSMEIEDSKGEKRRVQDTDYVLTTRELGHLIQRHRVKHPSLRIRLGTRARSRPYSSPVSAPDSLRLARGQGV